MGMANRVKEDEKNERIIRGLLKLPENRRCINCNSLVCYLLELIPEIILCARVLIFRVALLYLVLREWNWMCAINCGIHLSLFSSD